jgi:CRISPR system Cascade subunit CasC
VEFNSACYYKYFTLDYPAFIQNLAGPAPTPAVRAEADRVAALTVPAFLQAAVFTTPSGKQNTFAAHQLPDGVLVEVRRRKSPVSYANAFVKPAQPAGQADLVEDSLRKFAAHVELLTRKFSLEAAPRFWFTTRTIEIPGVTTCETLGDLLAGLRAAVEVGHV